MALRRAFNSDDVARGPKKLVEVLLRSSFAETRCFGSLLKVYPPRIMPAPTVTPVASSIRMNEPVVRFFA